MAVRSKPLNRSSGSSAIPFNKIMAAAAQLLSLLTTLWFVEWVWPTGQWPARLVVALVAEGILFALKSSLFRGDDNPGMSWTGFIIDSILNMGGVLPVTSRMITFPPIAAVLGATQVLPLASGTMATMSGNAVSYGGFILAIIGGILLSVAPHYLWTHGGSDERDRD